MLWISSVALKSFWCAKKCFWVIFFFRVISVSDRSKLKRIRDFFMKTLKRGNVIFKIIKIVDQLCALFVTKLFTERCNFTTNKWQLKFLQSLNKELESNNDLRISKGCKKLLIQTFNFGEKIVWSIVSWISLVFNQDRLKHHEIIGKSFREKRRKKSELSWLNCKNGRTNCTRWMDGNRAIDEDV